MPGFPDPKLNEHHGLDGRGRPAPGVLLHEDIHTALATCSMPARPEFQGARFRGWLGQTRAFFLETFPFETCSSETSTPSS